MQTDGFPNMLHDEADRFAARKAATWGRRYGWWFVWVAASSLVLLISITLVTGSRGSTVGQWLMKQLPIGVARVSYRHRPYDYRAYIFEDGTYELYELYDPDYARRSIDILESPNSFVELNVLVYDHHTRKYGWWGLTRERLPLLFAWDAWSSNMNRAPPNHPVYDQIRVEIVDDLCRQNPASCGRYREAIAAGATVRQAAGAFQETYAVTRIVWSGYAHNAVAIAALVLLPLSLWRMFVARRQCIRWRQMWQRMKCPMCSYDLRGTTEPRCPECGMLFISAGGD